MSGPYLLKPFGGAISSVDGVIRAADLKTAEAAGQIVQTAETRAREIIAQAETLREEERRRGHAEGLEQAARSAAGQRLMDLAALDRHVAALEQQIALLVHDCVRQIIADYDEESLCRAVTRSALATMRSERRARLHVASEAAPAVRQSLDTLLTEFPEIELIDVIEDPGLSPPDLRLESALGVVSFVLDDTLSQLRGLLAQTQG